MFSISEGNFLSMVLQRGNFAETVQKIYTVQMQISKKSGRLSICDTTSEHFSFSLSSSEAEERHKAVPLQTVDSQVYIYQPG